MSSCRASRSPTNLASLRAGFQNLGYMFDEAHFRVAFGAACPQIELYESLEDVPRQGRPATAHGSKSGSGQGTGLAIRADDVGAKPEEIRPKDFGSRTPTGPSSSRRSGGCCGSARTSWRWASGSSTRSAAR